MNVIFEQEVIRRFKVGVVVGILDWVDGTKEIFSIGHVTGFSTNCINEVVVTVIDCVGRGGKIHPDNLQIL